MKRAMFFPLIVCVAFLNGCTSPVERPSRIVQKANDCGAGDAAVASFTALQDWFAKHRSCAVEVDAMCRPLMQRSTANWMDSAEGRVCLAARSVAQWIRRPAADHQAFQSGWR